MVTDIAIREPGSIAPYGGIDLGAWAIEASQCYSIAQQLAGTSFVPKVMQGRPDEVCAAMLTGRELGLPPMSTLRAIDVIDGTPAMRALLMRALVLRAGHDMWVEESTETRAIIKGKRRGSNRVETSTWTMDRARKAGLTNKRNWQNHPGAMLVARGTTEVARLIAPDELLALPYSIEELEDDDGSAASADGVAPSQTVRPARRTAQRAARVDPAPVVPDIDAPEPAPVAADDAPAQPPAVPELDDEPVVDASEPASNVPGITDAQRRLLHAAFRDAKILSREHRLTYASAAVGRRLESSNDLTMAEASKVIDELAHRNARPIIDVNFPQTDVIADDLANVPPVDDWPPVPESGGPA